MNHDPFHNPWQRLTRQVVYQNPWIAVYHDEVLRPDGQPGIYGMVHYRNRAVGVVVENERNQVLLVGQFRYTLDQYSWEIPEGGATEGESLLEAARRELAEETGYSAQHWRELLHAHLSNSVTDEAAVCFFASGLKSGSPNPEETEVLQVRWVDFPEVLAMIRRREITDSLSILGLQARALERYTPPTS